MSYRTNARQVIIDDQVSEPSTMVFVRNHKSPDHLIEQLQTLYYLGHVEEFLHLADCVLEVQNPLVGESSFFETYAKALVEIQGFSTETHCAVNQAMMLNAQSVPAMKLHTLCLWKEMLKDGLYSEVETTIEAHLVKEPQDLLAAYLLAHHLFWKNRNEERAIELLESIVERRPSFLKAWLDLGMAYKKSRKSEKAQNAFKTCLDLDTNEQNCEQYERHLQSLYS